ncbi:AAA family ATPase [Vibrio sp. Vb339]|uniref:AAA family ATPase n=1 Tax=Vibrio sp. Vb339 TaxID=1192013 RepID=UPI001556C13D|nr:ATP-binding protein [Vibrio sp. Vb339]
MKFSFSNIGFIDAGEVELGDFTVICGRNNTGKTYISHSIYGLLKKCSVTRVKVAGQEDIDKLFSDGECHIAIPNVEEILSKVSKEFSQKSLKDVFNSEENTFDKSSVSLSLGEICNQKFFIHESEIRVKLGEEGDTELRISTEKDQNTIYVNLLSPTVSRGFVEYALERHLSELILDSVIPNSFVITSERTGAAMFYKDLDSQAHSFIDHIVNLKENKKIDPLKFMKDMRSRYSLPIRSNIDSIRYASESIKNRSEIITEKLSSDPLVKKLKQLVGGTFKTQSNGIFYVPNKKRNRDRVEIPIHLTSSATKSLYLLDLYVRHIAKKGDVLIIDEPELNLHPDAQRLLAQLLVRVVNSGIKVVATTHSDHLLRELNTLLMLSNPDIDDEELEEVLHKYDIMKEDIMSPSKVRAYVNSSTSHKIYEMPVNKLGIQLKLFNDEINEATGLSKEVYYLVS